MAKCNLGKVNLELMRPAVSMMGTKIKVTAKFRASRRLRFEDTKTIMSPEIRPKQAPGKFLN